jgi:hypothetical protein
MSPWLPAHHSLQPPPPITPTIPSPPLPPLLHQCVLPCPHPHPCPHHHHANIHATTKSHCTGPNNDCIIWAFSISLPQTHYRQLHYNHRSYTATTAAMQPPLVEYSHHCQHSTATSDLHTLQTHTFLVSLPPHSRLTTDNSTATTRVTQPPLVEHFHRCQHTTATGDLCTNTFLANTFLTSIHAHNAWQIILLSIQPLPAYHSNCRQHSHWCQSNTATSARAAQPTPVTCTYLFEQHLHSLHLCLQHFSNSHHCNASTSRATQPPPELCGHHWCYAVTTGVAQPPPVIPILSFLLPLQHFQHTTNSSGNQ